MRRFFLIFLLLWPVAARSDQAETERGTQISRDIVFVRRGGRALHLHLVRPAQLPAKPLPVLLWVHGGLWRSGDASKIPPLLFELARRGYAGVSVEFRSSDDAVFPAQLDDLRAATRFLRQKSRDYSLDAQKIGVGGISTGAHLASLLALSGGARCAIDICGPTDLITLNQGSRLKWDQTQAPVWALLGGAASEKPELARAASPLHRVSNSAPPFLILHGEEDSLVPITQSEALFGKLAAQGGYVTYRVYRGEEHGLRGAKPEVQAEILAFLARWLLK